jgi:hypothetical protein
MVFFMTVLQRLMKLWCALFVNTTFLYVLYSTIILTSLNSIVLIHCQVKYRLRSIILSREYLNAFSCLIFRRFFFNHLFKSPFMMQVFNWLLTLVNWCHLLKVKMLIPLITIIMRCLLLLDYLIL